MPSTGEVSLGTEFLFEATFCTLFPHFMKFLDIRRITLLISVRKRAKPALGCNWLAF